MADIKIERALLAVSDKSGITDFARGLVDLDIELVSTGGTAKTIRDAGLPVTEVKEITGFPEILGGRVKTLHPKIHGGLLADLSDPDHRQTLTEHEIGPIGLLCVNLYPFEKTVAAGAPFADTIEQIDIGGPAMTRAAAKNHSSVAVVVDPSRYDDVLAALKSGSVDAKFRRELAAEAFRRTAAYDAAISNWFGRELDGEFPDTWTEQWRRIDTLRYGENPHQSGAWYARDDDAVFSLALAERSIGNKALSYNNVLDASAAIQACARLQGTAAVVVKHMLPCGVCEADSLDAAFDGAVAGDPVSAFGGIVCTSVPITAEFAKRISTPDNFFEVICAPSFEEGAIEAIRGGAKWGKTCRIIALGDAPHGKSGTPELRGVLGGVLLQTPDQVGDPSNWEVVTNRAPTESERADLEFAWRALPEMRSNAIALAAGRRILGVGAGQPSRLDAVGIAARKAGDAAKGSVLASDAFFPFPDGVETAIEAGVRAIVQPGGSRRDDAVIECANAHDVAMLFTGERHFRH